MSIMCLLVATALWLPALHLFFSPNLKQWRQEHAVSPVAHRLAERHLNLWRDEIVKASDIDTMRVNNAEWDFMGRTFLVLALSNMALHEPDRQAEYLGVIDAIIDDTIALEEQNGMYFFLMDYATWNPWVIQPERSVFVDGEIALMVGARRMVADDPKYSEIHRQLIASLKQQMGQGDVYCGESYPNECWLFCNAVAIVSMKMSDSLGDADHDPFINQWLISIRSELVDDKTGLLVSSFTVAGEPLDGPEGSSIWLVAHCLELLDEAFARDQYQRAKRELSRNALGFGYATEWPESWQGPMDIDSGPIIPIIGASAGSSGLALLGASSFNDDELLGRLITSLDFAAFPIKGNDELRYGASNQVGDAVLLYALVEGPLWERIKRGEGDPR